ncbi:hypothetical protein JCM19294_1156 [Nonlabens tegetincola]|uniref:Uncharacterized protein n=1 Tax=Nonlabens tegetincola TaxID=323273 RepID=A0A090Q3S4_9FLAO|nr:hypothetical protein JCM19294_1156 [Nonlabens tegetincola]
MRVYPCFYKGRWYVAASKKVLNLRSAQQLFNLNSRNENIIHSNIKIDNDKFIQAIHTNTLLGAGYRLIMCKKTLKSIKDHWIYEALRIKGKSINNAA